MRERKDAGRKGGSKPGGIKNRRYAGQWTGEIQERWDARKVRCRIGEMQERRDVRMEGCRKGEVQETRGAGNERCRKGRMQERKVQKRKDARKDGVQEKTSFCVVIVLYNSHKQLPFSYSI